MAIDTSKIAKGAFDLPKEIRDAFANVDQRFDDIENINANFDGSYNSLTDKPTSITEFGVVDGNDGDILQTNGFGGFEFRSLGDVLGDGRIDVIGSVFADDSTLLVDGVAGKIVGNVDTDQINTVNVIGKTDLALVGANTDTNGGTVTIAGGIGQSGQGGNVSMLGGIGQNGQGGTATISGGIGTNGAGGNVSINGGNADASFTGGNITVIAGTGDTGGELRLFGGNGLTTGGDVTINGGNGSSVSGSVIIGAGTSTDSVTIQKAVITGDITGSVFADNSTLLIDGVNGIIPYSVLEGAPTALSDFSNDLDYAAIVGTQIQTNGLPVGTEASGLFARNGQNLVLGYKDSQGTAFGHIALSESNNIQIQADVTVSAATTFDFNGATVTGLTTGASQLDDLSDVDLQTAEPQDGYVLTYDGINQVWFANANGGSGASTFSELSDTFVDKPNDGDILVWDNTNAYWTNQTPSSGGGFPSRASFSDTSNSLLNGDTDSNLVITAYNSYLLQTLQVDEAAWVRVYVNEASQNSDLFRTDPNTAPDDYIGLVAEVVTNGPETLPIGKVGFNLESPLDQTIPITVTNLSGTTRTFTVTLTLLQLE